MARRVVNHAYVPVRNGQQMWRLYKTAGERWTYFPRVRSSKHAPRVRTGVSGRLKGTAPAHTQLLCGGVYRITLVTRCTVCAALYRGKGKSNLFRVYERGDLSASWYRKTYEWIRTWGHAVRSSNFLFRYVYTVFERVGSQLQALAWLQLFPVWLI